MSRTTDFAIGVQEGTLTRKEKLIRNPPPMYNRFARLFKATELYRKAEGIRKGVDSNDPKATAAFADIYEGSFTALDNNINRRWLECLSAAQLLSNDYKLFDEAISPEDLIVKVIQDKPKIRRKLKRCQDLGAIPHLTDLGLA